MATEAELGASLDELEQQIYGTVQAMGALGEATEEAAQAEEGLAKAATELPIPAPAPSLPTPEAPTLGPGFLPSYGKPKQVDAMELLQKQQGEKDEGAGGLATIAGSVGIVTAAFTGLAAAVGGVVAAFSPATMGLFSQTMKDFAAVFGVALAPVIEGLTTLAQELGSVLLPIMRRLQPVVQTITQTLLAALLPAIDTWGSVLQDLVPIIEVAAQIFSNIGIVFRTFGAITAGLVNQLREWAGNLFGGAGEAVKSFTDGLRDAIQEIAKAALILVGYLAQLVGAQGFLEGMIKSLQPKPALAQHEAIQGLGAPSAGRVTGVGEFEKSALSAAFTATGALAPAPKDTGKWLEEVVKELKELKAGQKDPIERLMVKVDAVVQAFQKLIHDEFVALPDNLSKAITGKIMGSDKHTVGHAATSSIFGGPGWLYRKLLGG